MHMYVCVCVCAIFIKATRESYDMDIQRAVKGMCVCMCVRVCNVHVKGITHTMRGTCVSVCTCMFI
jgi:hypothetical protein